MFLCAGEESTFLIIANTSYRRTKRFLLTNCLEFPLRSWETASLPSKLSFYVSNDHGLPPSCLYMRATYYSSMINCYARKRIFFGRLWKRNRTCLSLTPALSTIRGIRLFFMALCNIFLTIWLQSSSSSIPGVLSAEGELCPNDIMSCYNAKTRMAAYIYEKKYYAFLYHN